MSSSFKISTAPRITTGRLFSKKIPSLKLPITFYISIFEEITFTMSWDDQMFAEKSRDLISETENTSKSIQRSQAPML